MTRRILVGVAAALLAGGASLRAIADGVLVFGGTGQLGSEIVKLLRADGEPVTVFVRPLSDRSRLDGLTVDFVMGDLRDEPSVAAAIIAAKPRVIINAVRAPIDDTPFYALTSRHIAIHAADHGVQQIIHHGAVGAGDNMADHPDVPWASVPGLQARMRDHGQAEQNFFAGPVPVTIIRNSRVWPHGTPSTGHAELTEDPRTLTPITRADLAILTMQCLDNPDCADRIFHARDESLAWPPPGE